MAGKVKRDKLVIANERALGAVDADELRFFFPDHATPLAAPDRSEVDRVVVCDPERGIFIPERAEDERLQGDLAIPGKLKHLLRVEGRAEKEYDWFELMRALMSLTGLSLPRGGGGSPGAHLPMSGPRVVAPSVSAL